MKPRSGRSTDLTKKTSLLEEEVRRLREELKYKESNIALLNQLLANMRIALKTKDVIFVLLTGVTADPGLGFNRAAIFLHDSENNRLVGKMAISPNSMKHMREIYEDAARKKYDFSFYIGQYYSQNLAVTNLMNRKVCEIRIPIDRKTNLLTRAFVQKKSFYVRDPAKQLSDLPAELRGILTKPFVAAPVTIDGDCSGVIVADNYFTDCDITPKKIQSLEDIASFSSTMIESALRFEKAEAQSSTDELTKLHNYRYFLKRLDEEVKRAGRYKHAFSLVFLDLDFFKGFNDRHGHLAGNKVLMDIAAIVKNNIRTVDIAARYGGDEFVIILPETDAKGARVAMDKLRRNILNYSFRGDAVTVSGGISAFPEDGKNEETLISKADQRLYTAKAKGRDQIL